MIFLLLSTYFGGRIVYLDSGFKNGGNFAKLNVTSTPFVHLYTCTVYRFGKTYGMQGTHPPSSKRLVFKTSIIHSK